MSFSQVSGRYATALFELAREKGALEQVQADVEHLGRELADPEVAAFLFDARVPLERKRARLGSLQGILHPLTFDFVCYLLDKRRLEVLRELHAAFKANVMRERNAVEGVVESPRPLGHGELAELAVALGSRLGKDVELSGRVNTELIAGVRVFVDNKLIDQSALGRLEALRSRLLAAPVGQAQAQSQS